MKEFWYTIQFIFTVLGGWLGYFLGGCDGLLIALVAFAAIDYITGLMCAISEKRLNSKVGFKGICRKVLIFTLVGVANIIDVQVIGTGSVLGTAVIFFYLSNEGVSLLENAAHLGLPIFFEAGAERYLLRHETADPNHYALLHPDDMFLENRKRCLFDLKERGCRLYRRFL